MFLEEGDPNVFLEEGDPNVFLGNIRRVIQMYFLVT